MKSKSFIAGALGVLLFFAGQSVPAQDSDIKIPKGDASTLPAPAQDSDIKIPKGDASTLPVPAQDSDIKIPKGDAPTLSAPDREASTLSPPVAPPPAKSPPARGAVVKKPTETDIDRLRIGAAAGDPRAEETLRLRGTSGARDQGVPSPAAGEGALAEERPSRTGMFWGVMAGMRLPKYAIDDTDWGNMGGADIEGRGTFNGGLFFGMDFGVFTGQAEVFFAGEGASTKVLSGIDTDITGLSILVPLIVKLDLHLGPVVLQPLAGLYLNFALGTLKESVNGYDVEDPYANPLLGVLFGGAFGINLGRGMLFADLRYAQDLGKTVAGNDPKTIWNRSALMMNVGYQFSLGRKK
jgi:hypothetical protein